MTTNIVRRTERSGTSQQAAASVLMENELGVLTDTKKLIVGDGNKAGGYTLTPDNVVAVWPDQADASSPLSLAWWIARANGAAMKLRLPPGTYNVLNDLTIPANVYLEADKGATIDVVSGKTLTLNCEIGADAQLVFSGEGTAVENYARRGTLSVDETALAPTALGTFRRRIKNVYGTAAELKGDMSLVAGMTVDILGYSDADDGLGGMYSVINRPASPPEVTWDEDAKILLNNGLLAVKRRPGVLASDPDSFSPVLMGPDKETNGALIDCMTNWYQHKDMLYYANDYTGASAVNVVASGLLDGKYQIDCSSFAFLFSNGVTFTKSVYNGNAANTPAAWGYCYHNKEHYYYGAADNQLRMLANDIGYYCLERGYLFRPNDAWSNVHTGDLIFFEVGERPPTFWHQIGHVGVVIGVDSNGVKVIEVRADTSEALTISYLSSARMATVTYLARPPYNHTTKVVSFSDRSALYSYLADLWSIMPMEYDIELIVSTAGIADDDVFGGKSSRLHVYKRLNNTGWFRFMSHISGSLADGMFDILLPIRGVPVTADNLRSMDRYINQYSK